MTPGPALPPAEVPFPVVVPYSTAPRLRPLGGAPHVVVDDAWPAALDRRRERLAADRDGVLVHATDDEPGLRAALVRAFDLLPWPRDGDVVTIAPLGLSVDLARAAWQELAETWTLACADDLVVLRRRGPGLLAAELLAVSFPSGWPPRERAGASLLELHGPVADGERLQRAAPALSDALLSKGPYVQHVWGLDPDGRLDRDPSAPGWDPGPRPGPAGWWLRVERQTTLPLGDRALFTIRPHLVPLPALSPARRSVLADALASMSPPAVAYKGLSGVRDDLVAWLCRSSSPG